MCPGVLHKIFEMGRCPVLSAPILFCYWSLDDFHRLFAICPHLKNLNLVFHISEQQESMTEASSWQTLIENYLPNLVYLHLKFNAKVSFKNNSSPTWSLTSFYNDDYWFQRRPHFQVTQRL